jgi:hypothetical protein
MVRDFDFRGQEVLSVTIFVRRDSAVKLVDGPAGEATPLHSAMSERRCQML